MSHGRKHELRPAGPRAEHSDIAVVHAADLGTALVYKFADLAIIDVLTVTVHDYLDADGFARAPEDVGVIATWSARRRLSDRARATTVLPAVR